MRILHVLPQFPYFGGRRIVGGYPSTVLTLAEGQQCRHHVEILSRTLSVTPTTTTNGVPIRRVGDARHAGSPARTAWFMARAALTLLPRRRRYDIIHIHAGYVDYLVLAAILRLAGGSRTVATIYCPVSDAPRRRRLQRLVVRTCGRLVTTGGMSRNVAATINELGARSECLWTPPLIDPAWWTDEPGERTGGEAVEAATVRVLFVGNAAPAKGLDVLFAAVAAVRAKGIGVSLTVTTELDRTSSDERVGRLRALASHLDLDDHVEYLGIVDDMRSLIRSHHVHVAPFRTTQGPSDYFVSTLEAMAAGTCVIASRLPGISEIVDHGANGLLVEPGDAHGLAEQLIVASDEATRRSLAAAARETMRTGPTAPSACLSRYEDFYDATT